MPTVFRNTIFMDNLHIRKILDPVLPQDAATKMYVDQHAADEVLIDTVQPRDVETELWVDLADTGGGGVTEEVEVYVSLLEPVPPWELWADLSGVQPPGGGVATPVEEVYIQATAPSAVTAELWMDLSAPDPVSQSEIIAGLVAEVARLRADLDALREER